MSEEMRHHLESEAQLNIARGLSPDEARFAARRNFGGVEQIKEHAREQRGFVVVEQVEADFRFAVRTLRKSPGFTAAVVATLAVGIGLLTAIVDVATPILWPQLPFPEAERLVVLRMSSSANKSAIGLLATHYEAFAEHATGFSAMGAESVDALNLVVAGEPSSVRVSTVTDGFFRALGVTALHGRLFVSDDHVPTQAGEAIVLSHAAWARFFGRDPAVVGQEVMLGGRVRTVVGVLAPGFKSLPTSAASANEVDGIYLASAPAGGGFRSVTAIARLQPGTTLAQAEAQLRTIQPEAAGPAGSGATMRLASPPESFLTLLSDLFRESRAQPFRIFLGAAGALYLIGCTTVANLMLSRAVGRRRELGVRLALGGTSGRIARLVVVEALLLAVLGAAAGTLLAAWAQTAMVSLIPLRSGVELMATHGFPWRTLGLALALGIPTCALAALASARRASHLGLADAMKEGAGTQGDSRRLRWVRGGFVVTQSALAVALLIGAGLMLRTVGRLQAIELGFDPAQKLVIFGRRPAAAVNAARVPVLNAEIVARIAALPGVLQAAQADSAPLAGSMSVTSFTVEGGDPNEKSSANNFAVAPGYFQTLGMKFVAGTGFADSASEERAVVVVNESLVHEQFPNENPLGRALLVGKQRFEIIGVVRDVVAGYRGAGFSGTGGKAITAQFYLPMKNSMVASLGLINVVVRLGGKPGPGFVAEIQRAIFSVDPGVVVTNLRSLDEVVVEWSRRERQTLLMLQILSGLALGLAAFGTFSVMAYAVAQRRGELGLRLVLGATPAQLMALVLQRGLLLGAIGIGVGLGVAAGLGRFLQSVLYQTSALDPAVFAGVAMLLLVVTFAACWLPARRAAKVDPMVALRAE